jgi:hypothetical protein
MFSVTLISVSWDIISKVTVYRLVDLGSFPRQENSEVHPVDIKAYFHGSKMNGV